MDEAEDMAKHGAALLVELCRHRDKLIAHLAHDVGALEEKMFDTSIERLASLQGCIMAPREAIKEAAGRQT